VADPEKMNRVNYLSRRKESPTDLSTQSLIHAARIAELGAVLGSPPHGGFSRLAVCAAWRLWIIDGLVFLFFELGIGIYQSLRSLLVQLLHV
jgi:hypothetical protein